MQCEQRKEKTINIEHITKGTEIITETGYLIPTFFNGHIVYCEAHTQTWPEDAEEYTDDTAIETVTEERLTLSEIAEEMRKIDGKNHKVIWGNPES